MINNMSIMINYFTSLWSRVISYRQTGKLTQNLEQQSEINDGTVGIRKLPVAREINSKPCS